MQQGNGGVWNGSERAVCSGASKAPSNVEAGLGGPGVRKDPGGSAVRQGSDETSVWGRRKGLAVARSRAGDEEVEEEMVHDERKEERE